MWPGAWSGRSQRWRGSRLSGVTGFALGVRGGDGGLRAMASSLGARVGRYSTSIREDRAGWEDIPDFVTRMTSSDRATRASRGEHETRGPVAWHRDCSARKKSVTDSKNPLPAWNRDRAFHFGTRLAFARRNMNRVMTAIAISSTTAFLVASSPNVVAAAARADAPQPRGGHETATDRQGEMR